MYIHLCNHDPSQVKNTRLFSWITRYATSPPKTPQILHSILVSLALKVTVEWKSLNIVKINLWFLQIDTLTIFNIFLFFCYKHT